MVLVCRGKLSPPFSTYRSARLRSSLGIVLAGVRLLNCRYHRKFTEKSPFRIAVAMRIVLAEAGLLLRFSCCTEKIVVALAGVSVGIPFAFGDSRPSSLPDLSSTHFNPHPLGPALCFLSLASSWRVHSKACLV